MRSLVLWPITPSHINTVEHSSVWAAFEQTRRRGTMHAPVHKTLRAATSSRTQTSNANTPTSSEEPSRETRPARSYFNPLLQYIMEPIAEKWKRCNHRVGLAAPIRTSPTSDFQTTFFSSAHDHHARRLDHSYDGTRPTTPHNENQNITTATSKRGRSTTVAVRGMNIEFLPPDGKIKCVGQLIILKNAVRVVF